MPAGGDNDLTCSVLGRFFLRDGHFTSFYVLFYKKKCCIFATEIISRLERMLFTIGYNRFVNCCNRLIMNKLHANTPPKI